MLRRRALLVLAVAALVGVALGSSASEWEHVWDGAYLELNEGTAAQTQCTNVLAVTPESPAVRALKYEDDLKLKRVAAVADGVDEKLEKEFGYNGATFLCRGVVRLFADAARFESCTSNSPGKLCGDILESEEGERDWGRCLQVIRFKKVMRSGLMGNVREGCSKPYTQALVNAAQSYWDGPSLPSSPLDQLGELLASIIKKGNDTAEVKEFLAKGPVLAKEISELADNEINKIGARWEEFFDRLKSDMTNGKVWKKAAVFLGETLDASRGACCSCGPKYDQGGGLPMCAAPKVSSAQFNETLAKLVVEGRFAPVAKKKLKVEYTTAGNSKSQTAQGCELHWLGQNREEVRCNATTNTELVESVVVYGGDQGCDLQTDKWKLPQVSAAGGDDEAPTETSSPAEME